MRNPLRKAGLWSLLALAGAASVTAVALEHELLGEAWSLGIAVPGSVAIAFGLVWGLMSALSAIGEARLRRGIGGIARWTVPPDEWEAFRAYDARRAGEGPGLSGDYAPRPADGRGVEVLFGRRQVIVDDSYHPLRRFSVPELSHVGWLQPAGAPECLEFGILYPRGRSGGTVPMAVRVPVPSTVRETGVLVFRHFEQLAPERKVGIALRRPWLVIAWSLGVTLSSALIGGLGWLRHAAGDRSDLTFVLLIVGLISGAGAALFTLILLLVTWVRSRAGA